MSRVASNPAFAPTEVTRFVKSLDTAAGTLVVETDAGPGYLKAMGNPSGPHALACELVATRLAETIGLPTFDYALVEVSELDELPFLGRGAAAPGPAFVTRAERGSTWGRDTGLLNRMSNPTDLSRLVCMDTWVRNPDRYGPGGNRVNFDNVFFSMEVEDDRVELRAMDFSHAFVNGRDLTRHIGDIGNVKDTNIYGLFPEFRKRLDRPTIVAVSKQLTELEAVAAEAVGLIPAEWEVTQDTKDALIDFITRRAAFLADTLEDRLFDPHQLTLADLPEGEP